ncbi:unnamed protein product [Caenorhabditis brenneri]
MARRIQSARIRLGWLPPRPTLRQWNKNVKARKARAIADRYTVEARDRRAVRRAEEAEKREAEMAAKKGEKGKKTTKNTK